jgi:hypothetical protein
LLSINIILFRLSYQGGEISGTFGTYGGKRNAYRVAVGKPEGKRPP